MTLGDLGLVRKINIDDEMQQAYLDYAMSVIVARALPDARDGLKPVHRRILYAMHDMGLQPDSGYKKSARIVGEVLGKYHPHGDMAVYETMARMAQDFSMRCTLVDGQGNFGSVDGDSPAAMRYTEARLERLATYMLADIDKNTIDYSDNFDGTLREPDVLPAAFPNLLVNGATGIAVGMATSIPPHNLGEVTAALRFMLERWEKIEDISVEDLMRFVKGPDFPTGGLIIETSEEEALAGAYGSGRGRVTVRAKVQIEQIDRGRSRIIVTELPYMTNKASLIERIASLVREGRLEGIADLRDESDRQGMRIVIELGKTGEPESVLKELYKATPMQTTFSIILLALVGGEPRMLSLKQALRVYLEHRLEVVRRRAEYDLQRAERRAHILEGLRIALANLDEIINLIRNSPDVETAKARLIKRFKLSEEQAQAILDMQLRRLASLERKKIEEEYKELKALIKSLKELLASPVKMRKLVSDELQAVSEAHSDKRRTQILTLKQGEKAADVLTTTDFTPDQPVWVALTREGTIYRASEEQAPKQSGTAAPDFLVRANLHDTIYVVSADGQAGAVPVMALPTNEQNGGQGSPVSRLTGLSLPAAAVFSLPPKDARPAEWYLLTTTIGGMVKKSSLSEIPAIQGKPFVLVRVNDGDRLGWVAVTDGNHEVLLVSSNGMGIRFAESEIRPMGLAAAGVAGMKLPVGDQVVGQMLLGGAQVLKNLEILLVTSTGKAKRLEPAQIPQQGRYGQGVILWKLPAGMRLGGAALGKAASKVTLHTRKLAPRQFRLDEAPLQSRTSQGQLVHELKAGDELVRLTQALDCAAWFGKAVADDEPAAPKKKRSAASGEKPASPAAGHTPAAAEDDTQLSFVSQLNGDLPAEKPGRTRKPSAAQPGAEKSAPAAKSNRGKAAASAPAEELPSGKASRRAAKPAAPEKNPSGKAAAAKSSPVKPAAAKPAASGKTPISKAAVSKPAESQPAPKKPAAKTPAANKPAASTPASKTPAPKKPAASTPAVKKPAGKTSPSKK